eukprot:7609766-Pyramimonas_sp.AAC.1
MAKAAGVKDESSEEDRCEDRARGRTPHPAARRKREAAAAPDTSASARHEPRRPGGRGGEEQSPGVQDRASAESTNADNKDEIKDAIRKLTERLDLQQRREQQQRNLLEQAELKHKSEISPAGRAGGAAHMGGQRAQEASQRQARGGGSESI